MVGFRRSYNMTCGVFSLLVIAEMLRFLILESKLRRTSAIESSLLLVTEEASSNFEEPLQLTRNERKQQHQQQNLLFQPVFTESYRILCTTERRRMPLGSYRIRCDDFRNFVKQYYPNISVDAISTEQARSSNVQYNATILIKNIQPPIPVDGAQFSTGPIYLDIVDELKYLRPDANIPLEYRVMAQNDRMTKLFPNHTTAVVTHWFNSYPKDIGELPPEPLPPIRPIGTTTEKLRVGSVWQPDKGSRQSCRSFSDLGYIPTDRVEFLCIEGHFDIRKWYHQYIRPLAQMPADFQTASASPLIDVDTGTKEGMAAVLNDADLGPGYLYRTVFRLFDVLIVLAKNGAFHNYQRVVSQMRSGVPVLLEINGPNHEDFLLLYPQYKPCTYNGQVSPASELRSALERMANSTLRMQCQQMGMEITKEYTPWAIVTKYLKFLGAPLPDDSVIMASV